MRADYSFKKVLARTTEVLGALTEWEAKFLYNVARYGPGSGAIVEIGSFQGKSTIFLAGGSKRANREKIYAIDPHQGAYVIGRKFSGPTYRQFLVNLKKTRVRDVVVPLRQTSSQAIKKWKQPIRLLFIDGDHTYAAVRQDLLDWEPFLIEGGVIALHDALNPAIGPAKAVVKLLLSGRRFSQLGVVDSIFYCIKKQPQTLNEIINWWFFSTMMRLVVWLFSLEKSTASTRLRRFIRQYLVKRWLKRWLTWMTPEANWPQLGKEQ
jgi:predicted O-methyltransferase YrrM